LGKVIPGSESGLDPANQVDGEIDRDYENLRISMQTLFTHIGIETQPAAA
jgi:hypothetical protein